MHQVHIQLEAQGFETLSFLFAEVSLLFQAVISVCTVLFSDKQPDPTLSLSTRVYKWEPVNHLVEPKPKIRSELPLRWTSIPSGGKGE